MNCTESNSNGIPVGLGAVTTENGNPVEFIQVSSDTVSKVRNLNSVLFPVRYSSSYYKSLTQPGQFAQLAVYQGACVGTIACRKQPLGFADSATRFYDPRMPQPELHEMYMMTLGVLAPYRRLGIGRMLLANAMDIAKQDPLVKRVVLHVKIDNDDALRFYHKHGFITLRLIERYYKNIEPPHAYLLEYRLR
ncbi:hypothetical protein IW140_004607 [Coemansia sp. RSA 1813]|nr:hypothetical protein EV178_002157 [Coemansia sp. RSA 1646]KAJ1767445.1 hypothetical protein LPJ74_005359 [Coemansia sp. RSA 1843]KAJ2090343.1 hypothetical protein IW138_002769 [Coemansia sp. RSA 986]KAJ2215530.1 hypothetical protein EV179_002123 [Coemansia sp. RSA 487]KAJ2567182.1 hypothetical protein IW140_004607 [Coemansia sp. RSA 1813]